MRACLMALAAAALLLFSPLQTSWAAINHTEQSESSRELDLPAALADDDSFDELPFEQLRQALREVERDPKNNHTPLNPKRYNLLLR